MEYEQKMQQYQFYKKKLNMDKPKELPLRMLFIPANSSATAEQNIKKWTEEGLLEWQDPGKCRKVGKWLILIPVDKPPGQNTRILCSD